MFPPHIMGFAILILVPCSFLSAFVEDSKFTYKPISKVPLTVTSTAFENNGSFPTEFTGDGAGISPPVSWSGAPSGTKYFALSLWHIPPQGELKSYWLVYNIPSNVNDLPKNSKSIGLLGLNDKKRNEYEPMKSKGPGVKDYHITVYALSEEPKFKSKMVNRAELLNAIKDITLAEGTISYKYERKKE